MSKGDLTVQGLEDCDINFENTIKRNKLYLDALNKAIDRL